MRLPVVGTAYAHGRSAVTARAATNLWFERRDGEKAPVIASSLPAANTIATFANARTFYRSPSDALYAFIQTSTELLQINPANGAIVETHTLPDAASAMGLARGGAGGVVVGAGGGGYAFSCDVGVSIAAETISGEVPRSVCWSNGLYLILAASGRVFWSADGETWDALDYANAEAQGDAGVQIFAIGDVVAIFGSRTIEIWGKTGNAKLPIKRIDGSVRMVGIRVFGSACQVGDLVFFWGEPVGETPGLYVLDGAQVTRVGGHDMEWSLLTSNDVVLVSAFSMMGHRIIALYGVGTGTTYWYDLSTQAITRVSFGHPLAGPQQYIDYDGSIYALSVSSLGDGKLRRLDHTSSDAAINWQLVTDHVVSQDLDRFPVDKVRVDARTGGAQMRLNVSRDGGDSWGSSRLADAGGNAGSSGVIQWDRYGTSPQFTFRLEGTGAVTISNIIINPKN